MINHLIFELLLVCRAKKEWVICGGETKINISADVIAKGTIKADSWHLYPSCLSTRAPNLSGFHTEFLLTTSNCLKLKRPLIFPGNKKKKNAQIRWEADRDVT